MTLRPKGGEVTHQVHAAGNPGGPEMALPYLALQTLNT